MQGEVERRDAVLKMEALAYTALLFEAVLSAAAIGYREHSWWVFGGALLLLGLAMTSRPLAGLMAVAMTVYWWGGLGWEAGRTIGDLGAMVVLAALGLVIGSVVHLAAFKWLLDWIQHQYG